jgi:ribosome maturation factor RimP
MLRLLFCGCMIKNDLVSKDIFHQLRQVLDEQAYRIVEISEHDEHGRCSIRIVIQASGRNTSIDDCAQVHRLVFPRLEMLRESRDVYLEVSTPGIQRTIKDVQEFPAFIGKDLRIMPLEASDWIDGRLLEAGENGILLQTDELEPLYIAYNTINRAKLVYNWEDKK